MKVYVLVLTCGQYEDKRSTVVSSYVDPAAAETAKLALLVQLEEDVRKHFECEKEYEKFIDENPAPGLNVCTCKSNNPDERCAPCTSWHVVYDAMAAEVQRQIGFNPKTFPMYAEDGFYATVSEIELHGVLSLT